MFKDIPAGLITILIIWTTAGTFAGTDNEPADSTHAHDSVTYEDVAKSPNSDWLTYAGGYSGQRHSPLKQINEDNVRHLELKWTYRVAGSYHMRSTPLVYDGIMYFANNNDVYALNASSGRLVWRWSDYKIREVTLNRGVALLDDKLFFATGDCRLVALDRKTGELLWLKQYAPDGDEYYATGAPLALKDKILMGISGGHNGARGFLAAFSPQDGKELWRFWTVPAKGEPGSETWSGWDPEKGGVATWATGSYDHVTNTVYWPTGNAWPNFDASVRRGDNLYSDSVLAIDPDTGKLKWYFQFTPGDAHDWDASETLILVDAPWHGASKKLLMQANRNGFFYVLDRTDGKFILGKPFIEKLTWAKGLNANGRPVTIPGFESPEAESADKLCPWMRGATNWWSPAYNPDTNFFYVVAVEQCAGEKGLIYLRAINPQNGKIAWEHQMEGFGGPQDMAAGTLSTAGGLVFTGDNSGKLMAFGAKSGQKLWAYQIAESIFASPMAYEAGGVQHIAIAAGSDIVSFAFEQ